MQKLFRVTVDISKKIPAPAFEVNTNDLKSVKLEITITNGQSLLDLTDVTPRINIRKPDNEVIFQDCEIVDSTAGKVQIVLENQAYLVPGTHTAEIACYKGSEITAITGTFSYKSIKGIMNDEAVESKSEFTAIDRKIAEARKLLEDIGENGVGVDEQARQEIQEVTAQLADTSRDIKGTLNVVKMLEKGEVRKIRLAGDSITYGTGATGSVHPPNSSNRVIVTDGSTVHREPNENNDSWGNQFKRYIKSKYPSVDILNAGIPGLSAWEAYSLRENLFPGDDDIIFVMYGTNDLWETNISTLNEFKAVYKNLLDYIKTKCKLMVVMTANPTINDYTDSAETILNPDRHFSTKDVDRVITEVCTENGYYHISFYREFLKFSSLTGSPLKGMLSDNTHPSDFGHNLIYALLQQNIGIVDTFNSYAKLNTLPDNKPYLVEQHLVNMSITFDTPITTYDIDKIHYTKVYSDYASYPEARQGLLTTFRTNNDLYSFQEWKPVGSNKVYRRAWTGTAWGSFELTNPVKTLPVNAVTTQSGRVDFENNVITKCRITTTTGNPENKGGVLTTDRSSGHDYFTYQEYEISHEATVYRRFWNNTTSAWSEWKRTTPITKGTASRNIAGFNKSVGDMVFDSDLKKPIWWNGTAWVDSTGTTV